MHCIAASVFCAHWLDINVYFNISLTSVDPIRISEISDIFFSHAKYKMWVISREISLYGKKEEQGGIPRVLFPPQSFRKLYQTYSCHKVSSILPKLLRGAMILQFSIPFRRKEKEGDSFKFHLRFNLRADMWVPLYKIISRGTLFQSNWPAIKALLLLSPVANNAPMWSSQNERTVG